MIDFPKYVPANFDVEIVEYYSLTDPKPPPSEMWHIEWFSRFMGLAFDPKDDIEGAWSPSPWHGSRKHVLQKLREIQGRAGGEGRYRATGPDGEVIA